MGLNYSITQSEEFQGASILFSDGTVKPVASSHPRYAELVTYLTGNVVHDEAHVRTIVEPARAAEKKLVNLTSRVARKGGHLLYDGEKIDTSLTKHIIRLLDEDGEEKDWNAYVRFLERLQLNPSKKSRKHLFNFVEAHGLSISTDGFLVGYKGVNVDGTSVHAGYGIVDGKVYEHANLPNEIGSVIEIPRHMVDDNRDVACSTGLHFGTEAYARSFASRLLTVLVDPADVVSVPSDHNDSKVRVSKYKVQEIAPAKGYDSLTVDFGVSQLESETFGDDDDDDDDEDETQDDASLAWQEYQDDKEYWEDEGIRSDLTRDEFNAIFDTHGWDYDEYLPKVVSNLEGNGDTPIFDGLTQRAEGSRVDEYKALIQNGGAGDNLKRFRNKSVTAGRREEFDQAVEELGLTY